MQQPVDGKRRVAEAVWRIVATQGVAGLSVRAVAAEAGLTGGTVQYHFPARAKMVHYAMELLSEQFTQRLRAVPREGPTLEWTRLILLGLLPLSEERHREFRVWLAFTTHAHTDPALNALKQSFAVQLRELYQHLFRARRAAIEGVPEVPAPDRDPAEDPDVAILQAVVDGLALQLVDLTPEKSAARGPHLLDHYLTIAESARHR